MPADSLILRLLPSGPGNGFSVVRYHSLAVDESSLPVCLEVVAWTCSSHRAVAGTNSAPEQVHAAQTDFTEYIQSLSTLIT